MSTRLIGFLSLRAKGINSFWRVPKALVVFVGFDLRVIVKDGLVDFDGLAIAREWTDKTYEVVSLDLLSDVVSVVYLSERLS